MCNNNNNNKQRFEQDLGKIISQILLTVLMNRFAWGSSRIGSLNFYIELMVRKQQVTETAWWENFFWGEKGIEYVPLWDVQRKNHFWNVIQNPLPTRSRVNWHYVYIYIFLFFEMHRVRTQWMSGSFCWKIEIITFGQRQSRYHRFRTHV